KEMRSMQPHAIQHLLFYSVTAEADPAHAIPVLIDVSASQTLALWKSAMEAHASQMKTRDYVDLQLTRARLNGLRAGVGHAIALFPADPIMVGALESLGRGARQF